MHIFHRALAAAVALSGLFLAASESTPPLEPVPMVVTAEGRQGKNPPVLNEADILAFHNNQRLPISSLTPARGDHAALDLFILVDDDASAMSLGTQLNSLRQFVVAQPATTSVGIAYARNGTAQITQAPTPDRGNAAKALRLPMNSSEASASPFLSLSDLIKKWPAGPARREVLLVSSGIDPLGGEPMDPYLDAAVEHAQRAGIVVYALYTPAAGHGGHSYWRIEWGQNHLAQIAEETGGESYMLGFQPLVSFAPYLRDLADHLTNQYLVTILTAPGTKGEYQRIRLATEAPDTDLVYASKVYVPAAR